MQSSQNTPKQPAPRQSKGAIGKAILVYLGTGSIVVAGLAYLLFAGMGC